MTKDTQKTMFSKASDNWTTPKEFYEKWNKSYHFTLDPCATDENHLCDKYFTIKTDGLKQDWSADVAFVNPPYSQSKLWIKKAYEESKRGAIVVMLLPARTDTKVWHEYIFTYAASIIFVKGRLKFNGSKNCAPFPSAVIVFDQSRVGECFLNTMDNK